MANKLIKKKNLKSDDGKQVDKEKNLKPVDGKQADEENNLNVETTEEEKNLPANAKHRLYVKEKMKVRRAKNILTNIKKYKIITNKGKHSCKP